MEPKEKLNRALLKLLAGVWAGLIFGVSFLATIAKFSAPSLTMPVALDVGRHTFAWLVNAEWGLTAVAVWLLVWARPGRAVTAAWGVTLTAFAGEVFWLLPELDRRVGVVLAGGENPPSSLHWWFVAGETVRMAVLLGLGVWPRRGL